MGIYIKGMEMPKDRAIAVVIHPDGTAYSAEFEAGVCTKYLVDCEAVPVPTHGRTIDADALFKEMERKGWCDNADRDIAEDLVLDAPTIIPPEK